MDKIAFLYWTIEGTEQAQLLVERLLEKKLIACANILPGVSMYAWQGKISSDKEVFVLCKTTVEKLEDAVEFIEQTHHYEVPCITSWLVNTNKKYAQWVASVV